MAGSDGSPAADTLTIGGDLTVRRLGLGTNRLRNTAEARTFVQQAAALGVSFIDTADIYTGHESEQALGEALAPHPAGPVVATKGAMTTTRGGGRGVDASPAYLRRAVAASLQRLKREQIDLYFLHRVDPEVPIAESMGALRALQQAGLIRHVGLSAVTVPQIEEARQHIAIVAVENEYSIAVREHEPVLRYCEREALAFVAYYPLRPMRRGDPPPELAALQQKHGASVARLALAWLLHHSPALLPIPGTTSATHLAENLAALQIKLTADEQQVLKRLLG